MGAFRLRILNRDIELADGEYTIGRSRDCDIPVSDDLVSRKHAVLRVTGGRASIRDTGSRNGTFVNGDRINAEEFVTHLDQITVGAHDMMCIEDHRVRDQPPLHRCDACNAVVDSQDLFCRRCGSANRGSAALVRSDDADDLHEDDVTSATTSSSALAVLSGVAGRMLAAGNIAGAERVLEGALLDLLQDAIKSGDRPDELSIASECALDLAEGLGTHRWIEWTFHIHEACRQIPSGGTIDRLTELIGRQRVRDPRPIRKLLTSLTVREPLSPAERFSVRRLESLKKMCDPT